MAQDPFENWRRQHERLQRALTEPLQRLNEQTTAAQRAMRDPLDRVLRGQMQLQESLQQPVRQAVALQQALDGAPSAPLRAVAQQQEKLQQALAEPMARLARQQAAIAKALDAPYRGLLANQELLIALAQAGAAASTVDLSDPQVLDDGTEAGSWAANFAAALRLVPLSLEQLEALLSHLGFVLSMVVTGVGLEDGLGDSLEVAGLISMLLTACAILAYWIRQKR